MTLPIKLIAALAATTAAASTAAYLVINSQNGGSSPVPASTTDSRPQSGTGAAEPVEGPDDVKLCAGTDRVLHANREGEDRCPDGMQELLLAWDSDQRLCDLCDPLKDPPPPEPDSGSATLDALDKRIHDLENTAYFEVVSQKTEKTLFRVGPGGAHLYNDNGEGVAAFGTTDAGGYFTGRSITSRVEASIGASGDKAGVRVFETGLARVELGTVGGPYALRLPSGNGLIAGLGQTRAGSGAVIVGSLPGITQGTFTVPDGRGMVSLNPGGKSGGVAFTEATIGGGLLEIANNAGDAAVKMGHNNHRYGIVLAGPMVGAPLMSHSGLPGSYFVGCASGEKPACVPTIP